MLENPEDLVEFAASNGIYMAYIRIIGYFASVSFVGGLIAAFDSKISGYSLDPMAALFIGFKKFFPNIWSIYSLRNCRIFWLTSINSSRSLCWCKISTFPFIYDDGKQGSFGFIKTFMGSYR